MKIWKIIVEPYYVTTSEYYVQAETFEKAVEEGNKIVALLNKEYKDEHFYIRAFRELCELWDGQI